MNKEKNKKIIIVSYYFPPSSEVGGIRPAKFAKYLPEFGWEPIILTIKKKYIVDKDPERLDELRDIRFIRTCVFPTITQIYTALTNKMNKKENINLQNQTIGENKGSKNPHKSLTLFSRYFKKLRKFLKAIFEMPDQQIGWLFPAVWRGYRAIKTEKIEWIFATAPPATSLLVGCILSKLTGAKLILDFRDPCFSHIFKDIIYANRFSDAIEQYIGRKVIYSADKVITITEEYKDYLHKFYPFLSNEKIFVIWNGYEKKEIYVPIDVSRNKNKFVISYIGRFYRGQNPNCFFMAIRRLLNEGFIHEEKISLKIITSTTTVRGELLEPESIYEMIEKHDLGRITDVSSYLPYRDALNEMKKSDVLLVFGQTKHEYFIIPSKVFEIIGLKKTILCFTTGGATYNFLKDTGGALLADQNNLDEITEALKTLYISWTNQVQIPYKVDTAKFERRQLTKMLVDVIG